MSPATQLNRWLADKNSESGSEYLISTPSHQYAGRSVDDNRGKPAAFGLMLHRNNQDESVSSELGVGKPEKLTTNSPKDSCLLAAAYQHPPSPPIFMA